MSLSNQVCLLMWKNSLIQRRRLVVSLFEVILPALFSLMFAFFRNIAIPEKNSDLTYDEKQIILIHPNFFAQNGIIGYVPASKATEDVMEHVRRLLMLNVWSSLNLSLKGFATERDSEHFFLNDSEHIQHVLVFHGVSATSSILPKKISFSVRPHLEGEFWLTEATYPIILQGRPQKRSTAYKDRAVLSLQGLVGEALARYWIEKGGGNPNFTGFEIYTKRFVFPPFYVDFLAESFQMSIPLYIVLSFLLSVVIATKNIVTEKENKLKESMKLMGLTSTAYWLSWYLTLCVYLVPAMGLYTLMFVLPIFSEYPVVYRSDGTLLFVLLLVYAHALITYCFMISTFVRKGNIGATASGIVFFVSYLPSFYLLANYATLSRRDKMLYCLLFNTAMSMAIYEFGQNEARGEGATWSNFHYKLPDKYSISMLDCMIMMLVSSTVHMIITWYLENVRPGEFGVPKPYNFCFMKSYWCRADDIQEDSLQFNPPETRYFEKDPTGRVAGIRICNLRKEFGKRVAVAGTTLNMYEGQITVLLGHNGAGKTTTMAMLTGFIPPTRGTAVVNGYDIRTNIEAARRTLGLCPQHNILFDKLTVQEHFRFFSKMKGYSSPNLKQEIRELATKVGLEGKLKTYSKNLSGGQKRKLCVGIALIGGSKVVILDEPSSGMDPTARREIWSVLQEARQGRTILLTTHYMDEADLLGDRIAIMAEGVIKCCGTPLFLKKLYGAGYHLVVVMEPVCDIDTLTSVIQSVIPTAMLETVVNMEVTYLLPDNESKKFANLFRLLDSEMARLKISSYGSSATSMEEVFMKVGEASNDANLTANSSNKSGGNMYLTIMKKSDRDVTKITDVVQELFPTAEPTIVSNRIVTYLLPNNESRQLADLRAILESNKNDLNIDTFSTTMVSKIVDVGDEEAYEVDRPMNYSSNAQTAPVPSFDFNTGFTKKTGVALQRSQLKGIFVKKALLTWRSRVITLLQLVLPGLFTFLALLAVFSGGNEAPREPPLTLNIVPFGKTYIPYSDGLLSTGKSNMIAKLYKRQFCSCHETELIKLNKAETFDNVTGRKAVELGREYIRKLIIGMEVIPPLSTGKLAAIAYYNNQPLHSEAISVNYVLNALLQFVLNTSFTFKSAIAPLPFVFEGGKDQLTDKKDASMGFFLAVTVTFGMSFMTTLFIASLIKERQTGAKHMQIMTGISPVTYWAPTFLWDFLNFLLPSLAIPVLLEIYQVSAYTKDGRSALMLLILAAYGWAVLPQMYILQFLFISPPSGIAMVIMFSFLTGVPTTMAMQIMLTPGFETGNLVDTLDTLFILGFPNYNFAACITNIDANYQKIKLCLPLQEMCRYFPSGCCKDTCGDNCVPFETNYLSTTLPGIGRYLISMACQGVVFFLIVMAIEYKVIQMLWYSILGARRDMGTGTTTEDSDVAAERKRINSTPISTLTATDSLVLVNLYKKYFNFVAVDHICVGIPDQECFGLLGQNGAGKTSTFKMITGDIILSGGNAYLKGYNIRNQIKQVQARMGYCPQFNPLIGVLTGRETLTMYARLRGIPEDSIGRVVKSLAEFLKLSEHLDDYSANYSGGTKRKLSTAISLIGDPPFILLDEPSSGMDPEAKRSLWTVLSRIRASGRTLVLTSHSMDECDAVCTRIAIMVNGRFVCLGSPQHLKSKFAQGYTLILKLGVLEDGSFATSQSIIDVITEAFPGAVIFDDHEGYVHFQVPDVTVKVADIFSVMEELKLKYNLADYSVHQTTLEQVFLGFTKKQLVPPENTESKGFLSYIYHEARLLCRGK